MQNKVIKLTDAATQEYVLIGVESIIRAKRSTPDWAPDGRTAIESRHAMVTTTYVTETIEEIEELINKQE